jgi:hypothetical protein
MPQSECVKVRLKPGMTNKFLEWAKQVPNRMEEAKLCMSEPGVIAEHIFLDRSPDGDFIIVYWKAEDLQRPGSCFKAPRERWIWR